MPTTYDVFADYNMFFLLADGTEPPELPSAALNALIADLIAAGGGFVAIGTVRRMDVPVTVEVSTEAPQDQLTAWDHVTEAGIRTETGTLRLAWGTSEPDDEPRIDVAPGSYRVLVYSSGFDTLSEDGLDGDDRYRLVLWPAEPESPRVVHRYPGELPGG
ncbi:MAG TPA: hypothetical protein VHZ97_28700 [Pseudonocardiaceae bacterium]|nr:hypothetical protein [Pseudonocardiaceae bacterium]